jgi:hypothetical protein
MTSPSSQRTNFTLDVTGLYVCNGLDEAIRSNDQRGFTAVTAITGRRR